MSKKISARSDDADSYRQLQKKLQSISVLFPSDYLFFSAIAPGKRNPNIMKCASTSCLMKFAAVCACYAAVPHADADEFMGVPSPDYVSVPPLITHEPYSSADVQPYTPPTVRTYPAPLVYEPSPEVYGPLPAIYGYCYGVTRVRPHWRDREPDKRPNNQHRQRSVSD